MSSQVISYRLSTDEVLALRQKAQPGESDNQAAQRLMREVLGVSTALSTVSTVSLDERIESIVEDRFSSLVASQNEVLSGLQERLDQLETEVIDLRSHSIVDNAVDSVDSLTQADLAKRLGVDSATLTKNRKKPNFLDWSQNLDPEGLGWKYIPELKRYVFVPSTELSTVSTDINAIALGPDEVSRNDLTWEERVELIVGDL